MKKITLIILLIANSFLFAQQQQYNLGFEPSTPSGVLTNWATFENPNPGAEIITNPDPDGVNTSTTTQVMKFSMTQAAACYGGAVNFHGTLGTWMLDSAVPSNNTLSMQVNKSIVGKVGIKFANATNGTVFEIKDDQGAVNTINEWVTLTWDISGFNAGDNVNIDQMVIFIDWRCGEPDRTSDVELLVDNITWGANKLTDAIVPTCTDGVQNGDETGVDCGGANCAPCANPTPITAAPTPPVRAAGDVISMFSESYSNIPVDTWRTGWSQATLTDLLIDNNPTKKYSNLDYVGVETVGNNVFDISSMENFHIDMWTPNMTEFKVKLVDFGANGIYQGGDDVEYELIFTPNLNEWNNYEIPLSSFTGLTTQQHIAQIIFSGIPVGGGTAFIDNVYFYKTPMATETFEAQNVKMYPNPATNLLSIEANAKIEKAAIYNVLGQEVLHSNQNSQAVKLDISALQTGLYVVKATIDGVTSSSRLIKN